MGWSELLLLVIKNWDIIIKPILNILGIPTDFKELKKIFLEGEEKMETTLFYEVVNASNASDVLNAFETAKKNNKKYYRCKTATGIVVGWNKNNFISAESATVNHPELIEKIGNEVWFTNPQYVNTSTPNETPIITYSTPAMPPASASPTANVQPSTTILEPLSIKRIKDNLEETTASFTEIQNKYSEAQAKIAELTANISERDRELSDVREQFRVATAQIAQMQADDNRAAMRLNRVYESVGDFIKLCSEAKNSGK